MHDTSVKHKELTILSEKRKREEKYQGAKNEEDLRRQLASIENAALEAIAVDREGGEHSSMFAMVGLNFIYFTLNFVGITLYVVVL